MIKKGSISSGPRLNAVAMIDLLGLLCSSSFFFSAYLFFLILCKTNSCWFLLFKFIISPDAAQYIKDDSAQKLSIWSNVSLIKKSGIDFGSISTSPLSSETFHTFSFGPLKYCPFRNSTSHLNAMCPQCCISR